MTRQVNYSSHSDSHISWYFYFLEENWNNAKKTPGKYERTSGLLPNWSISCSILGHFWPFKSKPGNFLLNHILFPVRMCAILGNQPYLVFHYRNIFNGQQWSRFQWIPMLHYNRSLTAFGWQIHSFWPNCGGRRKLDGHFVSN